MTHFPRIKLSNSGSEYILVKKWKYLYTGFSTITIQEIDHNLQILFNILRVNVPKNTIHNSKNIIMQILLNFSISGTPQATIQSFDESMFW